MKQGFVYIMASATRTIYTGVTNDLGRRVWEHKNGLGGEFTRRYNVTKLVWFEEFARMDNAIALEKALKGKTRVKKTALIEERNPRWNDLAWNWFDIPTRHAELVEASPGDGPHPLNPFGLACEADARSADEAGGKGRD